MRKNKKGFTLVELMVTVAVAAILLAVGVPSLTSIYEAIRVNNNIEKINNILAFARNQAISYGATVNVCVMKNGNACDTGANWNKGIRIYTKDTNNVEHELRTLDAFNVNDKLKGPTAEITFSPEGLSSSGTFIYCPGGKANGSKSVTVSSSGLVSYATNNQSC
ncbi:GspH/FimT family pseudopilin [Shewanella marisflavi]|uniref:Type II secretion system protein H n=1 Tax=Shewanella marisflavi TaxID=260364 RepID=A0AAC9U275_9GAMM|nr:GspH/FimT family pseudopilin [Shewanella marisflavi]ASJ97572.1 methylation site containing protein [Shewanella marisflavi]